MYEHFDANGQMYKKYSIEVDFDDTGKKKTPNRDGHKVTGREFDALVLKYAEDYNVPYETALVEVCLSNTEAYKRYEAEVKSED